MTKYRITVRRIVRQDIQVEITALDPESALAEAEALASLAPEDKWETYDCEYWHDDGDVELVQ